MLLSQKSLRDGSEWAAQTLQPLDLVGWTEQRPDAAVFLVKHPTEIVDIAELEKERQQPLPAIDEVDLARPANVEIPRIVQDHPDRIQRASQGRIEHQLGGERHFIRTKRKPIIDAIELAIVCRGQFAEPVAANRSDDIAVEKGRIDARRFVERFDDPLACMIGIFLAQAHLFDVDAVPEAIDLVFRGRIDRFTNIEAVVQWSIHDNSFRDCACARMSYTRHIAAPRLSRNLVDAVLVIGRSRGPSRSATSRRDDPQRGAP